MPYPFALDQEFTLRGRWWRPSVPDDEIHGVLSQSGSDGCTLDLVSSFGPAHVPLMALLNHDDFVVHGWAENDTAITLWNCFVVEQKFGATNPLKLRCHKVAVGHHFQPDDKIFSYIETNTTGLSEWLGTVPITADHRTGKWQFASRLGKPRGWKQKIPALEAVLSPQYEYEGSLSGDGYRLRAEVTPFLRIEPDTRLSVDALLNLQWRVNSMLTALMGDVVFSRIVRVWTRPPGARKGVVCYVLYPGTRRRKAKVDYGWMPGSLARLRRASRKVMARWFERENFVKALSGLYFNVLYSPSRLFESELLLLTQALERYHRLRFGGRYVTEAEYDTTRRALVGAIPQTLEADFREALKSRIKYGAEFSLRKRLKNLIAHLPDAVRQLIALHIPAVVDSRNYYTHYDPTLKPGAAAGGDLQILIGKLSALVVALIYFEIDFPQKWVPVALRRSKFFGFAMATSSPTSTGTAITPRAKKKPITGGKRKRTKRPPKANPPRA